MPTICSFGLANDHSRLDDWKFKEISLHYIATVVGFQGIGNRNVITHRFETPIGKKQVCFRWQIDGLAPDRSNSSALAMEWLQSYAKPSKYNNGINVFLNWARGGYRSFDIWQNYKITFSSKTICFDKICYCGPDWHHFNIKLLSYLYRKCHYKYNTIAKFPPSG